ncbi:peptidase c13 family protein [Cystoisospora suis]|uniref:Peptidase c13 family protein n=1 Tax=Cystoisospora suis TaxID=483139 RepID=A0A2C6KVX1_9APIC|nr:peptidase c13 family protein [Cystoisospora suis]
MASMSLRLFFPLSLLLFSLSFLLFFRVLFSSAEDFRNNWAVIVNTSRYWYNYRHTANALSIYHTVKRLGIPDSRIILMLADDHACSPRNAFPGQVFNGEARRLNLYGGKTGEREEDEENERRRSFSRGGRSESGTSDERGEDEDTRRGGEEEEQHQSDLEEVEVDYRGDEVQVDAFLRLLAGRHSPDTPRGKRLLTDENSHVLVYLSGHGGEGFLKFQDWEEVSGEDLASSIAQMKEQRRFKQLLLIAETCQGSSLLDAVYTPDVLGIASSAIGESSYSHHSDSSLGVSVIDRWTYYTLQFFEKFVRDSSSSVTFDTLMKSYSREKLMSTATVRADLFKKSLEETKLTEFFAATGGTLQRTHQVYPLSSSMKSNDEERRKRRGRKTVGQDTEEAGIEGGGEEEGSMCGRRTRRATEREEGERESKKKVSFFSCSIPSYYARHFRLFKDMGEEPERKNVQRDNKRRSLASKEEGKKESPYVQKEEHPDKNRFGDVLSSTFSFSPHVEENLPPFLRDLFVTLESSLSSSSLLLFLLSLGLATSAGVSAVLV